MQNIAKDCYANDKTSINNIIIQVYFDYAVTLIKVTKLTLIIDPAPGHRTGSRLRHSCWKFLRRPVLLDKSRKPVMFIPPK